MEILIVVSECGGRSSVSLGWERRDWGFDVTGEPRNSVGKRGGGSGGNVATEVCDLLASCPDHVTRTLQT